MFFTQVLINLMTGLALWMSRAADISMGYKLLCRSFSFASHRPNSYFFRGFLPDIVTIVWQIQLYCFL